MATTQKKKLTDAYQYSTGGNQEGIKKLSEYKNIVNQGTSALSNLNTANQTALKYADTAMQAQGFSTQGANTQNITNLQNAYMNQVGQQNLATQQQVGQLQDTASANAYNDYINAYANAEATGTLNDAELSKLQNTYFNLMNSRDLANAETFTRQGVSSFNQGIENEATSGEQLSYSSNNGTKYSTNVNENSGNDFNVKIGTQNYNLKLGKNVEDTKLDPSTMETGQISTYTKNGVVYLITKDSNGNIRYVNNRTGRQVGIDDTGNNFASFNVSDKNSDLYNLAEQLGFKPQEYYSKRYK